MISIQSCGQLYKKRTSKGFSGSLLPLKSNHEKFLVNLPIITPVVGLFESFVATYIEKDLQKIFRTILKTRAFLFDKPCKKLLKARLFDVYCDKSYIEYYNFCQ